MVLQAFKSYVKGDSTLDPHKQHIFHNRDSAKLVENFVTFCQVDERLEPTVVRDYRVFATRFLNFCKGNINRDSVRDYLQSYTTKAPKTYNNQLCGLKAFVGRYLKHPEYVEGFKKAYVDNNYDIVLPNKVQVKLGFDAQEGDRDKAIYLFYATSGLRKNEALKLNRFMDIDYEMRCIKSKHSTRTKKAGVSFYNDECEIYLKQYLESRKDSNAKLFCIGTRDFNSIWQKATKVSGVKITAQILRKWHSTELGELGVPDRYVDVFQGRAPKSVIAKHYTGKELERLSRIYQKADLRVLS